MNQRRFACTVRLSLMLLHVDPPRVLSNLNLTVGWVNSNKNSIVSGLIFCVLILVPFI